MFKITLKSTWNKHGISTNYIKYLNVDKIERVFDLYSLEDILEVEEV